MNHNGGGHGGVDDGGVCVCVCERERERERERGEGGDNNTNALKNNKKKTTTTHTHIGGKHSTVGLLCGKKAPLILLIAVDLS